MWGIAARHLGSGFRWKELLAINPQIKNPRRIFAWRKLRIPTKPGDSQQAKNWTQPSKKLLVKAGPPSELLKPAKPQQAKDWTQPSKKLLVKAGPPSELLKPAKPQQAKNWTQPSKKLLVKASPPSELAKTSQNNQAKPLVSASVGTPKPTKALEKKLSLLPSPSSKPPATGALIEPQVVFISVNGEYQKVAECIKAKTERFILWDTMTSITHLTLLPNSRFIREWDGKTGTLFPKERRVELGGESLAGALLTYKGQLYVSERELPRLFDISVRWPSESSLLAINSKRKFPF